VLLVRDAEWVDVVLVYGAFLLPSGAIFSYLVLREWRRLRRARNRDRLEAEAMAAEGFPPPGPPTTVQPTDDRATLQGPPKADDPDSL
jgi:hypothetical protein